MAIINIIISIASLIISTILACVGIYLSSKTAKLGEHISVLGNNLSIKANEIANYSANILLVNNLKINTVVDTVQSFRIGSKTFFSQVIISGSFTTAFGRISKIGLVEVEMLDGKPNVNLKNMKLNPTQISSYGGSFTFKVIFEGSRLINDMFRSHAYIWVLDSNFNLSLGLIEMCVNPINTTGSNGVVLDINKFNNIDYYYRYLSEYDLLAYNEVNGKKSWYGKSGEVLMRAKNENLLSEDLPDILLPEYGIEQKQLLEEIKNIRTLIRSIVG